MRAMFLMFLARLANLRVERDSMKDSSAGETIAIMVVLQLPPKLVERKNRSKKSMQ